MQLVSNYSTYIPQTGTGRFVVIQVEQNDFLPTTDLLPKDYIQATQSRKPLQCHAGKPLKPTHPSTKVLKQ